MNLLRSAVLRLASAVPAPVKAFVYRRPRLLQPLAKFLKRVVPTDGEAVVNVTGGPNRGMRLVVDRDVPNYFWLSPDYEPEMQHALSDALRPGMIVADVGAHMGFDTIHMARMVGPLGHVHAFEPDPANAKKLRRNCELNDLRHVSCHAVAVADLAGTVSFLATGNTTSHIASDVTPGTVTVPAITLDEAMANSSWPRLQLVKLDVEGAEFKVLLGASRTLHELRPVWLIEVHTARALADCGRLLRSFGYRIEPLTPGDYYAKAVACLERGDELPAEGFDVGHIRAVPL